MLNEKEIILNQLTTDISGLIKDFANGLHDDSGIIKTLNSCLGKVNELTKIENAEMIKAEAERGIEKEKDGDIKEPEEEIKDY